MWVCNTLLGYIAKHDNTKVTFRDKKDSRIQVLYDTQDFPSFQTAMQSVISKLNLKI